MFRQARPKRATAGAPAARERLERLEVRNFEVDHVGAPLWHLDFHHGSRKVLTRAGQSAQSKTSQSRFVLLRWIADQTRAALRRPRPSAIKASTKELSDTPSVFALTVS